MKRFFLSAALGLTALLAMLPCPVRAEGTPKIQFESTFFDFGHVSAVESITGKFKFKNVGDGVLKLDAPEPSCGCTDAKARPDVLQPGESGEITYRIKLEHQMDTTRKQIGVHSNDPQTPNVQLTMQLSYDMIYDVSTKELRVTLPAGKETGETNFTVKRNDEKPLGVDKITTSRDWITAVFDPAFKPQDSVAQVKVTVHRAPGPPAPINAVVQLWTSSQPESPVRTLELTGEVQGELVATPPRLYWSIPNLGATIKSYPDVTITRKIELKSALGNPVEIKSVTSSVTGMSATVTAKEAGKAFEVLLRFDELPKTFTNGIVTIETSLASLPKLEVPLTIAVFKP